MKKILVVAVALVFVASLGSAANELKPKATSPLGAVLETSGVIVGKVTNAVEKSLGNGKKEGTLVLAEENGTTKIIPLADSVKALDAGYNIVTLDTMKGKKVSVSMDNGKATTVQEVR